MKNSDLKSKIYQQLDQLDEAGLEMVNEVVNNYLKNSEVKGGWDLLSEEDRAAIEEGLEQLDKGLYYTHEEVMESINKKLLG